MYKNILILGSNKTGKTTLSKMINEKYGCSIISLDNIIDSFDKTIVKKESDYSTYKINFILKYLENLSGDSNFLSGKKYVIEGNISDIETLISKVNRSKIAIIGLTYDNLDSDKLFSDIRKNDTAFDWTNYLTDEKLKDEAELFIERNKRMSKQFDDESIKKYDVSENRDKVFEAIVSEVDELARIDIGNEKVKKM